MPRFNGLEALKLALARAPFTPVIILTGAINEDTAVECMKAGAANYVIKEQLKRLSQAVIHAIDEKRVLQERYWAERALRESEERYRILFEGSHEAFMILEPPSWKFTSGNSAMVNMFRAMNEEELVQFVREQGVGLVGIGAMTRMIAKAYRMADAIRAAGVPVVMGGPHVTEVPDEALGRDGGPRRPCRPRTCRRCSASSRADATYAASFLAPNSAATLRLALMLGDRARGAGVCAL